MSVSPASEEERQPWKDRVLPPVRDLGGGVWSLPVPIPDNPLRYTLVYLLESERGPVLVDTGWDDPRSWELLRDGVAATGHALSDVHGVLVTHFHPDHHGLSGRIREESGAWIAMHAAEAEAVRTLVSASDGKSWGTRMAESLRGAGLPADRLEWMRAQGVSPLRAGAHRDAAARSEERSADDPGCCGEDHADGGRPARAEGAPRLALPDRELVHGESAGVPGRNLRVVWTPGHTPGHVCLHLQEEIGGQRGRLLSGDHLLPTISPAVGIYPGESASAAGSAPTDPLGDFLDSLERVAALDPAEVLPAHQYRFTGAADRVAELLDHHARRLAELHAGLRDRPRTLWEAAQTMHWNRPWPELSFMSQHMALAEAAAHVRRLVKTGLAEVVPDTEPVLYRAL